jgi:hypothetical protein
MAYSEVPSANLAVGKPVKKSVMTQVNDNLIDHESRISALSAGANKIQVFEHYIDPLDLGIGHIIPANMTLFQFQQVHGTGWIIADGGSCAGSVYNSVTGQSVTPDLRDEFLRGASGSVALGTAYADTTALNGITMATDGAHVHDITGSGAGANSLEFVAAEGTFLDGTDEYSNNITSTGSTHTHSLSGDAETRPQNFGVNFFIKINLSAQDKVVRFKARESMSIVSSLGYIIDNSGLPTSGNLEFDIKKGATIGTLSTVYTTKPTLAYSGGIADGDPTSSGTPLAGGYDITAGEWLQLDITSLMNGQSGIYIQVFAEPA